MTHNDLVTELPAGSAPESPGERAWQRLKHGLIVLLILSALIGLAAPAALSIWRSESPTVVLREGDAGSLLSSRVTASFFVAGTVTHLVTSAGDMTIRGAFSGPSGTALVFRQDNKTPGLQVCTTHAPVICAGLVGTWLGSTHAVPVDTSAVDFARYGWTADNLSTWAAFGVLAVGVVVVFGLAVYTADQDDGDDCDADDECDGEDGDE